MHYHAHLTVIRALEPEPSSRRTGHADLTRSRPAPHKVGLAALLVLATVILSVAVPARADARPPDEPGDLPACVDDVRVRSFTVSPDQVALGQQATVRWSVFVPRDCARLALSLNGQPVGRQGNLPVEPIANWTYALRAKWSNQPPYTIATRTITVVLPPEVTIDGGHLAPLFVQAVGTVDTTVRVVNGVELDLSRYRDIAVARGVTVFGGRTPREPGPRLYTTTAPKQLFVLNGVDDVRMTGLRIQGSDMDVAEGGRSRGIDIRSSFDVEIDHNELYGWKSSAVGVSDEQANNDGPLAVRIHDNFIHHNQRTGSGGYGVVVGTGAYALIGRNVFDYNRHAISGDGSDGSGYRAYENLVLQHGGRHKKILGWWFNTHQFDMHGQGSCGYQILPEPIEVRVFKDKSYNCGTAGHYIDIRENSFLYTRAAAIKLRGTPQKMPCGATVVSNVFRHASALVAVRQTERGLCMADNRFDTDGSRQYGHCDFDADGIVDRFMATGRTWWYASGDTGHWVYLHTARQMLSQVRLGDFDGDGYCDVIAGGQIFHGGLVPLQPPGSEACRICAAPRQAGAIASGRAG